MDKESPFALTDQHAAALERAIRAEGYDITVNPESGDVKLARQIVEREWFERQEQARIDEQESQP
jgi:hypothetical protein